MTMGEWDLRVQVARRSLEGTAEEGAVLDVPNDNFNTLSDLVVLLVENLLLGRQELRRLALLVRRLDVSSHHILAGLVSAIS